MAAGSTSLIFITAVITLGQFAQRSSAYNASSTTYVLITSSQASVNLTLTDTDDVFNSTAGWRTCEVKQFNASRPGISQPDFTPALKSLIAFTIQGCARQSKILEEKSPNNSLSKCTGDCCQLLEVIGSMVEGNGTTIEITWLCSANKTVTNPVMTPNSPSSPNSETEWYNAFVAILILFILSALLILIAVLFKLCKWVTIARAPSFPLKGFKRRNSGKALNGKTSLKMETSLNTGNMPPSNNTLDNMLRNSVENSAARNVFERVDVLVNDDDYEAGNTAQENYLEFNPGPQSNPELGLEGAEENAAQEDYLEFNPGPQSNPELGLVGAEGNAAQEDYLEFNPGRQSNPGPGYEDDPYLGSGEEEYAPPGRELIRSSTIVPQSKPSITAANRESHISVNTVQSQDAYECADNVDAANMRVEENDEQLYENY